MAGKLGIGDLAAMGLGNVGIGPLNVGNVLDTVDFVKRAWASIGVPSSFAPTVDLEELDKRIADLKAVEQWLTINMNMLQGTIQALEIQRGTIATLKAFGAPVAAAAPATQAIASALARAAQPQGLPPGAAAPSAAVAAPAPAPDGESPRRSKPARRKGRGAAAPEPAAFADPGLSPSAWWNLLQSQFNQVAAAALSGVGLPRPEAAASQAREKPARGKPRRPARAGAPRRADGADGPAGATAVGGRRGAGGRKD